MKALIICAGRGSRLSSLTESLPKPLLELLGLRLIERVILSLREAGIREFYLVLGYRGEQIKAFLGDGKNYQVKIEYLENPDWEKGNGISVLIAKEHLKEKFLLVMADHIFDPELVKDLLRQEIAMDECLLAVDTEPAEYQDISEATKVKLSDSKIIAISKELGDFDGLDCGIFLCTSAIFPALEESIKRGDDTLTGGVRVLAERGKMRAFSISPKFWIDIDTEKDLVKAEKLLLKNLSKPTDGPVSKYLNRPLSTRLTRFLVRTRLTPNQLTFISFLISLLAGGLFALGKYPALVLGGIMAQFASILDGCDGEVAKLKFQKSDYGAWFDAVLDRYADALLILGACFGHWLVYHQLSIWLVGFFAILGGFMNSYTAVKYDAIFIQNQRSPKFRIGRDLRLFLIFLAGLFNQVWMVLLLLAILTNLESLRRLYSLKPKSEIVLKKELESSL